jgi:hypothetical protein
MNRCSLLKSLLGIVVACGLSQTAFAGHGHGGGHHHHGGGHYGGGHHHHHGGWGFGGWGYPGYGYGYGSGFSLYIGSGYPSYGYGNYGYGPYGYGGYGYGGYGLSPYDYSTPSYYSVPQTHYYGPPSYSSPTYNYSPTSQSVPVPSRSTPSTRSFDRSPIVLTNPATNDKPVAYSLNGHRYTMSPGQSQKFTHDRDWIVEFGRGNGQRSAKYGLKSAAYKFKPTAHGWELFETTDQNSAAKVAAQPKPGLLKPKAASVPRPETFVLDTDSPKPAELNPAEFQADEPKPVTVSDVKAASSQPPETVIRQRKSTKSSDAEEPAPGPRLADETDN